MAGELKGRTIAVLATDGVEQVELTEPMKALKDAGAEVRVVSDKDDEIQAFKHHDKGSKIPVDETLDDAEPTTSTDWSCRAASSIRTRCGSFRKRSNSSAISWKRESRSLRSATARGR